MSAETTDRDDDVALAGEYALGLLSGAEAAAFEARLAAEPELRALHAAWVEDFALMADEVPPASPRAAVLAGIERRLFGAPGPRRRAGAWRRLGLAGLAAAGMAALVILATIPFLRGPVPPGNPVYTAEIAAEDGALIVAAAYDDETGQLFLDRRAGGAAPGRALELWFIEGDAAPVSLGVLSDAPVTVVPVAKRLRPALRGGVLAISDEPPGGSPTGMPTGAVLATGTITDA